MSSPVVHNVLVVEPEASTGRVVLEALAARGVRGTLAANVRAATERLERGAWDLVVADLEVPGGGGWEIVRTAKTRAPEQPVVLVGAKPCVATAVRAMREGCDDFLVKPLDRAAVDALLDAHVPNRAVPTAEAAEADGRSLYHIAGRSPALLEAVALARKVAPTAVPVLVTGESGTGKELIAHLLHHHSRRAGGPYVRVNCAAVSESLLESELFGHERGAFTGAVARREGRFETAHGGTLLLDEITETGPRLQAELLRVLEQQDFQRVGGSEAVRVNVRIVSTTNRELAAMVREGDFRADLYYRLAGVRIHLPPLRRRREDVSALVWHFVNEFAREAKRKITRIDPDTTALLRDADWPGNVRQLRNVVRTAMILGEGEVLSLAEAPWLRAELAERVDGTTDPSLRLRDVERRAILQALRLTDMHQARAAELLGITDRTLRDKLRRYREEGHLEDLKREEEPRWLKAPA